MDVDRSKNLSLSEYNVYNDHGIGGAKSKSYVTKEGDNRHFLDFLNADTHRPFLVSLTCVVDSPMKLFVYNQNYTSVLFGSKDEERVKNVVRFEANLRWFDFMNMLPVNNKKSIANWKITDFNNILNENPLFDEE